jgi:5-hydroxyisourate hydrolase-like protein (transthyretin family)
MNVVTCNIHLSLLDIIQVYYALSENTEFSYMMCIFILIYNYGTYRGLTFPEKASKYSI